MKEYAFSSLLLLFACMMLPTAGFAAGNVVSASQLNTTVLKSWTEGKYECRIDDDGDLIVQKDSSKIFVQVIPKAKVVRIFSSFKRYDKLSIAEMIRLANQFNDRKRFLRVSIDPEDGSSTCDHYIVYDGGLNRANFQSALDWFFNLKQSWADFVLSGGKDD